MAHRFTDLLFPVSALLAVMTALLIAGSARAQTTGNCAASRGDAFLDANNVSAQLFNTGGLFYRAFPAHYEVPEGSGINSIFTSSIWIAGMIDGELRVSASLFENRELWAGPLDHNANPPANCDEYDRIYKVVKKDVTEFETTGTAATDLREWPTGLGAPTLDADGNIIDLLDQPLERRKHRLIDLSEGERPAFRGDQAIWWLMNDVGNEHKSTNSEPLGIEVHVHAYAASSHMTHLDNTTFFRYRLFNKSLRPITDMYIGLYVDADIGNWWDDFAGSDTTRDLGFVYNADNFDEDAQSVFYPGYGESPPAVGSVLMEGPHAEYDEIDNNGNGQTDEIGERLGMTAFAVMNEISSGPVGSPSDAEHYYRYLQGRWRDGTRFGGFGFGYDSDLIPTNFMYPGDPETKEFWSEMNDGGSHGHMSGERRFTMSSGPFTLDPGQETDFSFAYVWARGTDHLNSVTKLKRAAEIARIAYETDYLNNQRGLSQDPPPPEPGVTAFANHNYPEPFSAYTTIAYGVPGEMHVRITVHDILGRRVATLVDEFQLENEYSTRFVPGNLPSGLYFYTVEIGPASITRKMVLQK